LALLPTKTQQELASDHMKWAKEVRKQLPI
jgi:hypothetical protein